MLKASFLEEMKKKNRKIRRNKKIRGSNKARRAGSRKRKNIACNK